MRTIFVLVACSAMVAGLASADEPDQDGMNCRSVHWIENDSCSSWMSFNGAEGHKWSVRFSRGTGRVHTIYGNRSGKVPGIDLSKIDRASARSDDATQALLRAYAKKRVRPFEQELGIDPNRVDELQFADFRKEPGETFQEGVADDGTVVGRTISTPEVAHIELSQMIDGFPVDGAAVTVTVSIDNELLGIHSTFRPETPLTKKPKLGPDAAIAAALAATATDLSDLDGPPVAFNVWVPDGGSLKLAWQVGFVLSDALGGGSFLATIFDQSGALRNVELMGAASCPVQVSDGRITAVQDGLRDGVGSAYLRRPPLASEIGPDSEQLGLFIDEIESVPLYDMCVYQGPAAAYVNGLPWGRYATVGDEAEPGIEAPSADYDRRVQNPLFAALRFDDDTAGSPSAFPTDPPIDMNKFPIPGVNLSKHDGPDEALLDEDMAYYHVDRQARFFDSRYHHQLTRATNTNPAIPVFVNKPTPTGGDNGFFHIDLDYTATLLAGAPRFRTKILLGPGRYLQPVADDLLHAFDVYAPLDWSLDPTSEGHEYSHAMIWDVSGLRADPQPIPVIDPVVGARSAYHEGMADFFSGAALDTASVLVWVQAARSLETDDVTPFLVPDELSGEGHHDGAAFSQSFWTLHARMKQLARELPIFGGGGSVGDRIAWGSVERVGPSITDYGEPLADALATDSDVFDGLLHYEILAAFADHGIKTQPAIALIRPKNFVLDGRLGQTELHARGYLGTNVAYWAEFATDPKLLGAILGGPDPGRILGKNYILIESGSPGSPPIHPINASLPGDTANFVVDLVLTSSDLFGFSQGGDTTPVFMELSTLDAHGAYLTSHISGAGGFIAGADDPGTLYVSPTAPAGCECGLGPSPIGSDTRRLASLGVLCFAALALVRRRCDR